MPSSIYKSLNFGDLEPTRMTIQLANISVVQPINVLEDVLVQVNELIFPADFNVLDMEDETSRKGSTLIMGRPFLITARTKIDEQFQLDNNSECISNFAEDTNSIGCFGSITEVADYDEVWEVHNLSDFEYDNIDLPNLSKKAELIKLLDQVYKHENLECANKVEV
ncbi:hypothetical protein CR513_32733, partial [Mucuna pruriens]